jgi:hypothetical protein
MKRKSDSGVALISAMLVLMLMSGLLVGFIALVTADQQASGANRDQTQAYAAAHAGVEKLTADLGQLFRTNFKPTGPEISALTTAAKQPNLGSGISFLAPDGSSGYQIAYTDLVGPTANTPDGNPDIKDPDGSPIPDGPYEGLIGLITPYNVTITARTSGKSEVRMRREMQTIAIPVFQFGMFCENDCSFFAGPDFSFGGRIHSNQSLYLKQDTGGTLTLKDRVTAVREIIRSHLQNGKYGSHTSTVRVAKASGCPGTVANCRNLAGTESSVLLGTSDVTTFPLLPTNTDAIKNPDWNNLSVGDYNSWLRNGRTGAKPLVLPIVDPDSGSTPIDLIRRPKSTEDPTSNAHKERFFHLASLRILLSDTAEEITALPGVGAGFTPKNLAHVRTAGGIPLAERGATSPDEGYRLADLSGPASGRPDPAYPARNPIHYGYILVQKKTNNEAGPWVDVTQDFLDMGVTGRNHTNGVSEIPHYNAGACGNPATRIEPNPNAIIRIQHVRDVPAEYAPCGVTASAKSQTPSDYWPNVLWDPREGALRDSVSESQQALTFAGVMHYVELDVRNLRIWLNAQANIMKTTGYVVYFSDRRGNKNESGVETGELGFEDIVNLNDAQNGLTNNAPDTGEDINPDGELDPGEDTNGNLKLDPGEDVGNGTIERYGNTARYPTPNGINGFQIGTSYRPAGGAGLYSLLTRAEARRNPAIFFRRALKLVNGNRHHLLEGGTLGLTVAAENPVYIQGDFNGDMTEGAGVDPTDGTLSGTYNEDHVPAAVIADAVTMLSNRWNDLHGFRMPYDVRDDTASDIGGMKVAGEPNGTDNPRIASNTVYRVAIISGKGRAFPRPDHAENHADYGTDGGAHNFLRYIERWKGSDLNYLGSLISLYFSRQAVGTYKCCDHVYQPPARKYNFDEEFLNPNTLPPRTPMFREINTLTFRQVLRPTEP